MLELDIHPHAYVDNTETTHIHFEFFSANNILTQTCTNVLFN